MIKIFKTTILFTIFTLLLSFTINSEKTYKCLIQLKNYEGEGAYVTVALINPKGEYQKTLSVIGEDTDWYEDIKNWFTFYEKKEEDLDAITGESIIGGERRQLTFKIDESLINKGYKIRFESAVEDQKYYEKDIEIPFSSENLNKKIEGQGYIRYINLSE